MRWFLFSLGAAAAACGPVVSPDGGGAESGSGGSVLSGSSSGPATPPSPLPSGSGSPTTAVPGTTSSSTTAASSSTDDTFGGFIEDPNDVPYGDECSIYEQDCEPGFKCSPYLPEGGYNIWGHSGCFPVDPNPVEVGDSCSYEGEVYSGHDNCPDRSFCHLPDENGVGECREYCSTPYNGTCADPGTTPYVGCQECECICEPTCSPLESDCPDGRMCVVTWGLGTCAPDASGDGGFVGDACEFINTCKPGLTCVEGSFVPGCESSACCTPYCDVTDPVCPVESECSGIWELGTAPPGLKDLGWCIDPAAE